MQSHLMHRVQDPQRLAALHELGLLDTPAEQAFDRLAKLAARILHTPVALVSLVDNNRQFFKSCLGLPEPWSRWRETPLTHSFCQHVVASGKPLVIADARCDPVLLDNLAIRDLNVIAYLGSPLILPGGQVVGSFCVIDSKPREWTNEEISIVRDLAASVMTEINLRHEQSSLERRVQERTADLIATNEDLRKSESRYRELVELAADGIFISNAEGHFVDINPAGCALSGYTRDEILHRSFSDLIPEADRERDPPRFGDLHAGRTVIRERNILRKDGTIVPVEVNVKQLPDGRLQGIVRDITERKRAQADLAGTNEQLRELLTNMVDGFVRLDREWRYVFVNQRAGEMFSRQPQALIGQSIWEEFPEGVGQPFYHAYQQAMTDQQPAQIESYYPPWDKWFENRIYPSPDGLSIFFSDITDRIHSELEREKFLGELTARNAEMENFIYTISHDLKTPLITIGGFASLLSKDLAKKDLTTAHDSLTEIDKAIEQMKGHIEHLLLLSRTGRVAAEKTPVTLGELIKSVLELFAQRIKEANARVNVAKDLPTIMVDPKGLQRVFSNLIDNALKYRREDATLLIEIGATRTDEAARIFVRDNGSGIRARYRERIFELFQRADSRTEGTGVGLAIARRVIEVHGGRMWVDSETGKGSTFWIELPASMIVSTASKSA